MKCNSITRAFELSLREEDEKLAPRAVTATEIDRIAEKAADYLPDSEWERNVQRFRDLMERSA